MTWKDKAIPTARGAGSRMAFCCRPDNDLYVALSKSLKARLPRQASPGKAVAQAPQGGSVLILADGYPRMPTALDAGLFESAAKKNVRLYVEFPSFLPGLEVKAPQPGKWQRAVVASDVFGAALGKMRILEIHGCHYTPLAADGAHLVLARVAGFDTAVYGLPPQTYPVLFELPMERAGAQVLVATTKLSQFVTARYAPAEAWHAVWRMILEWLGAAPAAARLDWTPTVRPSFAKAAALPRQVERDSLRRGGQWFVNAGLFLGPPTKASAATELGRHGVMEGPISTIDHEGRQPMHICSRNDCNGEAAGALALAARVIRQRGMERVAANVGDYVALSSIMVQGERADPRHAAYGLIGWHDGCTGYRQFNGDDAQAAGQMPYALVQGWKVFYGDDNARALLGLLAAAATLKTDRWNQIVARCLLANLRTTGKQGFRGSRLDQDSLADMGWRPFYGADTINYAPHFESWLWACNLWAYRQTGDRLFLDRTRNAIRMTMAAYPDQWHWTNGLQQERARMILPLAWLVRVEDTPEHRQWLQRMIDEMLSFQDESGAIREELGSAGQGSYRPPATNEAYGTNEAPLIQANGDPVADLLYTVNFAFLSLHEAAAATGDRRTCEAVDRLARFFCRIQIRSETHPDLDGGWFRAFDFKRWDYWASNADADWGVWCIESGWTQSWIVSVLALRQLRTSLWDLTAGVRIAPWVERLRPLMIPDEDPGLSRTL